MPPDPDTIADAFAEGLARLDRQYAEEQAVHGLDSLDELGLHPVLADALERTGLAVFRETPYPGQPEVLPKESERQRCDLVVADPGATGVFDLVRRGKALSIAAQTLFAGVAEQMDTPPPGTVLAQDCLWIEVKTLAQHTYVDGVAGPNRGYAGQAAACLTDVRKLARARDVELAALTVIALHEHQEIAEHDLTALVHKCLDKDLPAAGLVTRSLPVADRIGNSVCTIGVIPVRAGACP